MFFSLLFVSAYSFHIKKFEKHFINVPYAEDIGVIKNTKVIEVSGITSPCNASIIKYSDEFLLSFRNNRPHGKVELGLAIFDQNFQQQGSSMFLDLSLLDKRIKGARDARLFTCNNDIYLTYTFLEDVMKKGKKSFTFSFGISRLGDLLNHGKKLIPQKENTKILRFSPMSFGRKIGLHFLLQKIVVIISIIKTLITTLGLCTSLPLTPLLLFDRFYTLKKIVETDKYSDFLRESWEDRWGTIRGGTGSAPCG